MAPERHVAAQRPQPLQMAELTCAMLSSSSMAEKGQAATHNPQPAQRESST